MSGTETLDRRVAVWWTLYRRDLKTVFLTPAIYVLVVLVWLAPVYFTNGFLAALDRTKVSVSADPLRIPYLICTLLTSLYLAVSSAMSLCQERESRTLEVLFYGPVSSSARVLSLFLRDVSVFLICAASFLLLAAGAAAAGGLSPGSYTFRTVAISILLVLPTIGMSLLVSAAVRRTRTAVILVVAGFLILVALQAAGSMLAALPADSMSLFALYTRRTLLSLLGVLEWLSPIGYLAHVNDATLAAPLLQSWGTRAAALAYTAATVTLAVVVLWRRDKSA